MIEQDTRQRFLRLIMSISLFAAGFSGCSTATRRTDAPNFQSALLNLLTYAHAELGQNFSSGDIAAYDVRVITADMTRRYVGVEAAGYTGETRKRIENAINGNPGNRALVFTSRGAGGTAGANLVFLPVLRGSFPEFPDANAVVLSSSGARAGCGFRSFGQYGSQPWCASCAIGFCCGTCGCRRCGGTISSATQGLDLPPPIQNLFNGPQDFNQYEIDRNLIVP